MQAAITAGTLCGLDSKLQLHPSRLFAIYRFADSGSLIQEVIALGRQVTADARLIESTAD